MRLTHRREAILRALISNPRLTQEQIYALLGATTDAEKRNVRARTKSLHDHGLTQRRKLYCTASFQDDDPETHWQYQHSLSPRGVAFVQRTGLDPQGFACSPETKSPWILRHEADLADFDAAVLRAFPDARVWSKDADLRHRFVDSGRQWLVNPDRLYYFGGFCFFLELERKGAGGYRRHESQRVRKIRNYDRYARSRMFREKHPRMEDFFLLVAVDRAPRRDNLLKQLRDRGLVSSRFKLACEEDWRRDANGQIWHSPNGRVTTLW